MTSPVSNAEGMPQVPVLFAGADATLRVNQDCVDIVLEYAVASAEELRRFRTVSRAFHGAVENLIAFQLRRRRPTGPPPHPAGASVCQRGIDGLRLQLPMSTDTEVLRHVIGIAGSLIEHIDPRAWMWFRGGSEGRDRLLATAHRLPNLRSADLAPTTEQADDGGTPDFLTQLPAPQRLTALGISGGRGAIDPEGFFLPAVIKCCPDLVDLHASNVSASNFYRKVPTSGGGGGDDDASAPPSPDDALALPKLRRLSIGASSFPTRLGVRHIAWVVAPALVDLQLPFAQFKRAALRRVLALPTLRKIRNSATAPWALVFPVDMLPKGLASLAELEVLYGFTLPAAALPHLTSLVSVGFRIPTDSAEHNEAVTCAGARGYGALLADACRGSLKTLVLDINRPAVAEIGPAVIEPFGNSGARRESVLEAIHIHDFDNRVVDANGAVSTAAGAPPPMRFSKAVFGPHRFPKLSAVRTKYTPWAFEAATTAEAEDSELATAITEVSLRPPVSVSDLDILGAFAGRTLKYLDVETDYNSADAPMSDPAGLAIVLARYYTAALESFASPQCNAAGWRCSLHQRLRWVSVSVPASALAALVAEAAQCPLLERLRVRRVDPDNVPTIGLDTFTAGSDGVPVDVLSAPFGRHRCPRLVGVNGIVGCDPPRPGGEFVLRSSGLLWELASFG